MLALSAAEYVEWKLCAVKERSPASCDAEDMLGERRGERRSLESEDVETGQAWVSRESTTSGVRGECGEWP